MFLDELRPGFAKIGRSTLHANPRHFDLPRYLVDPPIGLATPTLKNTTKSMSESLGQFFVSLTSFLTSVRYARAVAAEARYRNHNASSPSVSPPSESSSSAATAVEVYSKLELVPLDSVVSQSTPGTTESKPNEAAHNPPALYFWFLDYLLSCCHSLRHRMHWQQVE